VSLHPTQSYFAFDLDPSLFPVDTDLSALFNIGVTLNVVFQNTDGTTGAPVVRSFTFNPLVMVGGETSTNEAHATASVSLAGPAPVVHTSSSNKAVLIGAIAGGSAGLVLILAALIVVYRRRVASKSAAAKPVVALEGVVAHTAASSQL